MKNKTVICNFYNEEYLLPWWLKHHRELFSDGLMIDYGSDDNSVNIIKELCPHWKIVNTKNEFFDAREVDREKEDYEKDINGYRIVLNVTEFLVGNFSKLNETYVPQLYIPMVSMVDTDEEVGTYPDQNIPLTKQRLNGVNPNIYFNVGYSRSLHIHKNIVYPIGRHFTSKTTDDFLILRYKHSPWNEDFIKRKLQIAKKQPESDVRQGFGLHHQFNRAQLELEKKSMLNISENIYPLIENFEYTWYENKK